MSSSCRRDCKLRMHHSRDRRRAASPQGQLSRVILPLSRVEETARRDVRNPVRSSRRSQNRAARNDRAGSRGSPRFARRGTPSLTPARAPVRPGGHGGRRRFCPATKKQEQRGCAEEQEFEEGAHRKSLGRIHRCNLSPAVSRPSDRERIGSTSANDFVMPAESRKPKIIVTNSDASG